MAQTECCRLKLKVKQGKKLKNNRAQMAFFYHHNWQQHHSSIFLSILSVVSQSIEKQ